VFKSKRKSTEARGEQKCGCGGSCASCARSRSSQRSTGTADPDRPPTFRLGPSTSSSFGYRSGPDFRRDSGAETYGKDAGAPPPACGLGTATPSVTWSGLSFSATATYTPCDCCRDGLEAMQVFWGTRRTDGVQVGTFQTVFPPMTTVYDSFVDGGRNSPGGAVYSGDHPYYIGRADLPASYGFIPAMASSGAGSVSGCTVSPADLPSAAALHQEAYFETVMVCLNHQGTGKDKLMDSVQWGFTGLGATHKASPYSSSTTALTSTAPSSFFEATLKADYPGYSHV
jgi:hypothetical protein